MAQTETRSLWSSKWTFVLAAAASAVGLGSMWRFPYLAAKYGGGTFLITYLVFCFTIGVSLLLLETALGRKTGQSAIGAFKAFGKRSGFIGLFTSLIPFIITPYYCVIGGWVAKYSVAYFTNSPQDLADKGGFFVNFITSDVESVLFMLVFMSITFLIVALGVNGGIEKANLIMMPSLIVMALGVSLYALTLPGAFDGVKYYLLPDFSAYSPELIIAALGQTFYTLSLAMGIMITYGSYLKKEARLTSSVAQIAGTTFSVSLLAGMMIVPATFAALGSGQAVAENSGPSLMFIILPQVFESMGSVAYVLGPVFFILVLFAALTSSISLVETCVSIFQDGAQWTRNRSLGVVVVLFTIAGIIINLGYSSLSFIQPMGEGSSILDLLDFISNSVMMPLAALMTCIFVGWVIKPQILVDEIKRNTSFKTEKAWIIMIKYVAPIVVVVILIAYIAQTLGLFSF